MVGFGKIFKILLGCLSLLMVGVHAEIVNKSEVGSLPRELTFEVWLNQQSTRSIAGILQNVMPHGAFSASPSKQNPDYFYHWVRDSGLVIDKIRSLYTEAQDEEKQAFYKNILDKFIEFSRRLQLTENLSGGLGEPKFHIDGSPYNLSWGRPQHDGPALRAISLIKLAHHELAKKDGLQWVKSNLYDGKLPSNTLIKVDLEFISDHWRQSSFDLWEEIKGDHFYTRLVQRRALLDGAELADILGDLGAAFWYRLQARQLEIALQKHWNAKIATIVPTLHTTRDDRYKRAGLDSAVILAVLHAHHYSDTFFTLSDEKVLSTLRNIRKGFEKLYPINNHQNMAPAIGRYPEDSYDGYSSDQQGNPWTLAICAFAEFHYRLASEFMQKGVVQIGSIALPFFQELDTADLIHIKAGGHYQKNSREFDAIIRALRKTGDAYLERLKYHVPEDLSLAEQINKDKGYMQGAPDLAWSYLSFLTANEQRNILIGTKY